MKRLGLIDLIRTVSIFPIVHFHSWEIVFFADKLLPDFFYQPHYAMYNYSRYFSFSGFTIVFLFYFLLGFSGKNLESLKGKVITFLVGIVTLSAVCWYAYEADFLLEWDIYHFLILSFVFFVLVKKWINHSFSQVILWGALALIPFWLIAYTGPGAAALIGDCETGTGMWPLFPGLFFIFLAYSFGGWTKAFGRGLSLNSAYLFVVGGVLGFCAVSLAHFRYTDIGGGFGCFIHRPPFWIWSVLIMSYLSLFVGASNEEWNEKPAIGALGSFLSKSAWNKSFGLCYLTQWVFLLVLYVNRGFFAENPRTFFLAPIFVILATELVVKLGIRSLLLKRSISLK